MRDIDDESTNDVFVYPSVSIRRGLEGIGLVRLQYSPITVLVCIYVELRDLAGVGHSYCVFLHSSVPSITQKSSGSIQRTLAVATPTFHTADSNSLPRSPFVELQELRTETAGTKRQSSIPKQKEASCRHEACT